MRAQSESLLSDVARNVKRCHGGACRVRAAIGARAAARRTHPTSAGTWYERGGPHLLAHIAAFRGSAFVDCVR